MIGLNKDVTLGTSARTKIIKGVDTLANAVKATLGPKGRNVIIEGEFLPKVTKDGVTVAKSITLKDPIENLGCSVVKMAAAKTNDSAGDGTTTSTVLAQDLIKEGHKLIAAGKDPVQLKREMDNASESIISILTSLAEKVEGDWDKVKSIATISANNDSALGELITNAFKEVGADGVISVDSSKTGNTYMEKVKGMQFDRGYLSPYFATNPNTMKAEHEDCFVFIYDGKIKNMKGMPELLGKVMQTGKPLLIIAEEVDVQTLNVLVVNKMRAGLPVVAVKSPAFGERKKKVLEDIAIMTGGEVISEDKGLTLENVDLSHLGRAKKVTVTNKDTTIVDGLGDKKAIEKRIETLRSQIDLEETDWGKQKVKERIGKLSNGVVILRIGAPTEVEINEIKDRVDDALKATRAALQEGIVPGGGTALVNAIARRSPNSDGEKLLFKSCLAPMRTIVDNCGLSGEAIVQKLLDHKNTKAKNENKRESINYGYNASTEEYVDLIKEGIIDPVKVVRIALENAVSVAGMIITTECAITNTPEEQEYDPQMITP